MKNLLYFTLIFLISCSTNMLFDDELTSDQKVYVMSILDCDAEQNRGFSSGHLEKFFSGEIKEVVLKYETFGGDKGSITILRNRDASGKEYFLAEFKSKTFPFTECRKLKTEPKYF